MSKPATIYKYESFSETSLRSLKAQSIYFGSPLSFNDPYDCALKAAIDCPDESRFEELRQHYLSGGAPLEIADLFSTTNSKEFKAMVERAARVVADKYSAEFLKSKGVTCFSERNDDLLMWSHYGGRYKGFCLEFSTKVEPFDQIQRVQYSSEMPKIDPVGLILDQDGGQVLELFLTKSSQWEYEKEWRLIHEQIDTLYCYPDKALLGVYFGPDIDIESIEIICLILKGQNPHVRFWKGSRSVERFEVNFEEVTYTAYVERP